MLSALEHCHRRFIVHHDIKLENVLVKWPAQDASKPVHVRLGLLFRLPAIQYTLTVFFRSNLRTLDLAA
jgi:serine/threonine protein kinase